MATEEIVTLVCDLHSSEEVAGAVVVWLGIGRQLYQFDACPECAARLREVLSQFLMQARHVGEVPQWLPRPDDPAGRAVTGPTPKRDRILDVLRERIADGTYPAGSYLPAQHDLAGEHGMSATPVRDACWALENDGLIRGTARGRYIVQPAAMRGRTYRENQAARRAPLRPGLRPADPGARTAQPASSGRTTSGSASRSHTAPLVSPASHGSNL